MKKLKYFILLLPTVFAVLNITCSEKNNSAQLINTNKNRLEKLRQKASDEELQLLLKKIESIKLNLMLSQYRPQDRQTIKTIIVNKRLPQSFYR